jgi:hypothetical protein
VCNGFVLGRQRSSGNLGHHETAVQATVTHEKSRQATQVLINEQSNAPL